MGILFAILAAITAGLTVVLTKAGIKDLDSTLAFAVQGVFIFIITWVVVLLQGTAPQLGQQSKRTWLFIIGAGICTTLSTICSYRALKVADASLVNPIERMSLVVAAVLSALFLKEKLGWQAVAGIALMSIGAVMVGIGKK